MNHWQQEATNARRAMKAARLELADMRRLNRMYVALALVGWIAFVAAMVAR